MEARGGVIFFGCTGTVATARNLVRLVSFFLFNFVFGKGGQPVVNKIVFIS